MPWETPKTNWLRADRANASDWARWRGNLLFLRDLARLYFDERKFVFESMTAPTVSWVPTANDANAVENNLEALLKNTFDFSEFLPKEVQYPRQSSWDYRDWNRIESMELRLYELLNNTHPVGNGLPFKMGGSILGKGMAGLSV